MLIYVLVQQLVQLTQLQAVLTLNVVDTTSVTCAGSCTGAAVIGFTGGTPAVTYSIVGTGASTCVPVQLTPGNFTGLGADTYTVTGTDGSTCTATTSFTIVEPMPFVLSVDDTTSVLCNGDCNGGALISFIGGNGGVTYTIAGPVGSTCLPTQATPGTFTTLGAGLYTVTGTDDKGCTATVNFTIVQPAVLTTDTISSTAPTCVPGCDGTVTMTSAGGNGNYVYTIAPSAGITVVGNVLSGLCAGTVYTITSTDDKGCVVSMILSLSNPNSPTIATTTLTPPSCGGYCDGSVVLNITGGTTPYGVPTITPLTGTPTWTGSGFSGLCANVVYNVSVSDALSCSAAITFTLTEPAPVVPSVVPGSIITPSCNGVCDASVTMSSIGGNTLGGYTYSIIPMTSNINIVGNTISGLCGDTVYVITSTDANLCTGTTTVQLTQPAVLTLNVVDTTSVTCAGSCTGAAVIGFTGGTPAVTYSIVGTGASTCVPVQLTPGNFTGLGADTYTVTGTDGSTCTATTSFTIVEPMPFVLSVDDTTSVLCNGDCNGGALISFIGGNGGVTYTIAGPVGSTCLPTQATPGTFTTLGAGLYTVTGTDDKGCTATVNFTIAQPDVLTTDTISSTAPTCVPGCDGTVTMTSAGGNGNYVYTIAPSAGITVVGNVLSGLCAGTVYTITSTDDKGCVVSMILSLSNPNSPTINITNSTNPTCVPGCDGTVTYTITNGTPNYTSSITPLVQQVPL
ncbi:MAG: hypothetical protein R2831_06035 [Chitinophagaceae bacterium]